MEESRAKEYYRELMKFYRNKVPQLVNRFDDLELQRRIAEATRKARVWGVHTGEGIIQFVGIALAAGPTFDEDPKVRHFLTLPGSTPERKVHRLLELVAKNLIQLGH